MLDRAHSFLVRTSSRPLPSRARGAGLGLALVLAAAAAACTKTEGPTSTSGTAASSTPTTTTASASASAATAAPDASPTAADTTTGTTPTGGADATAPAASASGGAAVKAASAAVSASAGTGAGPAECGTKPLPDCPLQAWMKANTNPAIAANDLPALAIALDKTAGFAPAGYTNWASIAKDGAKAARAGDMTAAKASCRTCHDQYKDKYKKEMRARKI
jgi:hypothetical protein